MQISRFISPKFALFRWPSHADPQTQTWDCCKIRTSAQSPTGTAHSTVWCRVQGEETCSDLMICTQRCTVSWTRDRMIRHNTTWPGSVAIKMLSWTLYCIDCEHSVQVMTTFDWCLLNVGYLVQVSNTGNQSICWFFPWGFQLITNNDR